MAGFDIIDYAVYMVETYRHAKGLSGEEVAQLFSNTGVFQFLEEFGDTLHCQSDETTIDEIDEYIKNHSLETADNHPLRNK